MMAPSGCKALPFPPSLRSPPSINPPAPSHLTPSRPSGPATPPPRQHPRRCSAACLADSAPAAALTTATPRPPSGSEGSTDVRKAGGRTSSTTARPRNRERRRTASGASSTRSSAAARSLVKPPATFCFHGFIREVREGGRRDGVGDRLFFGCSWLFLHHSSQGPPAKNPIGSIARWSLTALSSRVPGCSAASSADTSSLSRSRRSRAIATAALTKSGWSPGCASSARLCLCFAFLCVVGIG